MAFKAKQYRLNTNGDRLVDKPGFAIKSISVDNLTNIWLTVTAGVSTYFVPPQTIHHTRRVNSDVVDLLLTTTPGLPIGRSFQATNCIVIVTSEAQMPTSGVLVARDAPFPPPVNTVRATGTGVALQLDFPAPGTNLSIFIDSLTASFQSGIAVGGGATSIRSPIGTVRWTMRLDELETINHIVWPHGFRLPLNTAVRIIQDSPGGGINHALTVTYFTHPIETSTIPPANTFEPVINRALQF